MVRAAAKAAARTSPVRGVLAGAKMAARTSPEARGVARRVVGRTPGDRVGRAMIVELPSRWQRDIEAPTRPGAGDATLATGRMVSRRWARNDAPGRKPGASIR